MYGLVVLMLLFSQWTTVQPLAAVAQGTSDAEAAATVAVELSALEASGDFNTLYDRIHPDARAEIPRAAVIGWFQNEFAPRGPGISTVTDVNFVSWTWGVTGQTYPYTAEVSFLQPFADGTIVEDVVRLVQDHKGEWRWFFGRSREFVDEQIARYVPMPPTSPQGESIIEWVVQDIDAYWATSFSSEGWTYVSPTIVWMQTLTNSSCGIIDPIAVPAAYCPLDQTIYLEPQFMLGLHYGIGDFAWITVLSHEWGHHVQHVTQTFAGAGSAQELQADCLAGSYALNAETLGYLDPGDLMEALTLAERSGDQEWMPQDQPGAHGTSEDRVGAFMRGYLDGFIDCGFILSGSKTSAPVARHVVAEPNLVTLLPLQHEVPSDLQHSGDQQRSLPDVAVNYTSPMETERLFREQGWRGNVTRSYDGTGWNSGVTAVYVSIHQFGSSRDAAWALDYSLKDQAASTGAWVVAVSPLASTTRGLATSSDVTVYAQQGTVMIRLTVTAPGGDGLETAEVIMQSILSRAP